MASPTPAVGLNELLGPSATAVTVEKRTLIHMTVDWYANVSHGRTHRKIATDGFKLKILTVA